MSTDISDAMACSARLFREAVLANIEQSSLRMQAMLAGLPYVEPEPEAKP